VEPGIAADLVDVVRQLHARGLAIGTSGNFSAALGDDRLLVTPSGADKGRLTADQLVVVDHAGAVVAGTGKPSAETALHVAIVQHRAARAVLHVHSVWNTLLSQRYAAAGVLQIEGLEMVKGLAGVATHDHREVVPIVANSQDMPALARDVARILDGNPACHGFLIAGHGLYTWGRDLAEAHRHVEIFEFLFEVLGRQTFGR
jgi:methylthioribulose-1-phosphate dehydratase